MRPLILGIDAGWGHTGAALLELQHDGSTRVRWAGTVHTVPCHKKLQLRVSCDDSRRTIKIGEWLRDVIVEQAPALLAIEMPSGGSRNVIAAKGMARAASIAALVARWSGVPTEEVTPNDVKLAATGVIQTSKDGMIAAGLERWPGAPWAKTKRDREHAIDAAFAAQVAADAKGPVASMLWNIAKGVTV